MNTKFQYEQIGRIYDERRFINRNLMEDRKEEIRKAIPEFEALERSISETAAYDITAIIGGSKNALVNTKNRLREIENTKKSLLVTYHYPKNYLITI